MGKVLQDELIDFRSLKMKRYRAIYQIDDQNKTVIIYTIGHRRDIYEVITELIVRTGSLSVYFGVVPPSI